MKLVLHKTHCFDAKYLDTSIGLLVCFICEQRLKSKLTSHYCYEARINNIIFEETKQNLFVWSGNKFQKSMSSLEQKL